LARHVGTLFQDPERQFFAITVRDELAIGLRWRGWEPDRIEAAVAESVRLFGIEDLMGHTLLGLSEGQKQKVALASLMAARPKLLLLDEPSANLDPESTAELAKILLMLKSKGVALFVADHRLAYMRGVADRVLVMDAGRVVAQGDFGLLEDATLRERHGLRSARVPDKRSLLPDLPLPPLLTNASNARSQENHDFFACRDLTFAYPKRQTVLENINLVFPPGRVIALAGENGAGKTTLARLLTGLEKPSRGRVLAEGREIKPRRLARYAQAVLQNAAHQLRMQTVAAELEDAISGDVPRGEKSDAILYCMERYALSGLARRHPQSLSGGEQQRLAVACAAIRRPRVLILDEPTSGLDGENMRGMAASMERVARDGACVLVITHDLEFMNLVCAEKIVLRKQQREVNC
jgi:energy-coupling factor transport system ATP-binding protein